MNRPARITLFTILSAVAGASLAAPFDVGPNANAAYVKECGSCHFAYQPGLLPERSWRRLMSTLAEHFGESAEVKSALRDEIGRYLAGSAADHGASRRSQEIDASIPPSEIPLRVTLVPYISGVHGGLLDPMRMGRPAVQSLAHCAACHPAAESGQFQERRYTVSDEAFRRER